MRNKDVYDSYEEARRMYDANIVPQFGATRLDWGFGRWLWLDYIEDRLEAWRAMDKAKILTADGRKRLARAEKEAK